MNPNDYNMSHQNTPAGFNVPAPTRILADPLVANMAMQYGQALVGSGRQLVDKEIEKYVPISRLKYYFAVDTAYVSKKLSIILFPYIHSVRYLLLFSFYASMFSTLDSCALIVVEKIESLISIFLIILKIDAQICGTPSVRFSYVWFRLETNFMT